MDEINQKQINQGYRLETMIRKTLIIGTLISSVFITGGIILFLVTGQTGYNRETVLLLGDLLIYSPGRQAAYPTTIQTVLQGVIELKPFAVIELGLLLLMATPICRVMVSIGGFISEKDKKYVLITSLVLMVLFLSQLIGSLE